MVKTVGPLDYIGPDNLPKGWHRPTRELAERQRLLRAVQYQVAPPASPWLRNKRLKAVSPPQTLSAELQRDIKLMESHVNPRSLLKAAGMAHPQMLGAKKQAYRVIVVSLGKDLKAENLLPGTVFIDPVIKPAQGARQVAGVEMCFSCPAVARKVLRWDKVWLHSRNHPPMLLVDGVARAAQHECDHLDCEVCIDRGFEQGYKLLYYVPTDLHMTFYREYVLKGRLDLWPYLFRQDQYDAMMNGMFSFDNYFRYL
ncbi:MAG TPA: peptide deformylase [Candidatus Saccharimonadales bacterium]